MELVCLSQLARWSELEVDHHLESEAALDGQLRAHQRPVFACDEVLNSKVALWQGNLLQVDVEAIVHPTNERFERITRFTHQLYRAGGPALRRCLFNRHKHCRMGSVKVTKGYSILARHIIHTASPQYQRKYRSAAENGLFHCYYNVLLAAKQCQMRTIALGPLAIAPHHFPALDATHIGLRVVRRFLERFPDAFDLIVFVMSSPSDFHLYDSLLRVYFPRDATEEKLQCIVLPANVGGPMGEPVRPEREIRIKESPIEILQSSEEWSSASCSSFEHSADSDSDASSLVCSIGRSKFARMRECRDSKYHSHWEKSHQARSRSESLVSVGRALAKVDCDHLSAASLNKSHSSTRDQLLIREYQRQLRCERLQRKCTRLSVDRSARLAQLRQCIYQDGTDEQGRNVLTLLGSQFQAESMCDELTLHYVIDLLEQISQQPYVIVYHHTAVNESNVPKGDFLTQLNELLSYRHRKNLKAVFIVNPSIWSRLYFWWLKTFHFKSLKEKVTFVSRLSQLKTVISNESLLRLPATVQQLA